MTMSGNGPSAHPTGGESLDFIATTNYYLYDNNTRAEVPESWQWFLHPNLDVYYFNLGMRLLSTDDIRDPNIRALIINIRNEYYEELADDRDFKRLPIDWVMTITDCNLENRTAVVGIHSRTAGRSYEWTENGLVDKPKEQFWTFIAEYPAHDKSIPPALENQFVHALTNAQEKTKEGRIFPLDGSQIETVARQYNYLKAGQSSGKQNAVACIAWLMGAVMPLDELPNGSTDGRISNERIRALTRVHI
ncbi:hypothetical protein AGABI1DRAFT_113084 [Agaricus bisporus var. burnettii JB137-S8]|uniref:Uncharacterized protein n=1 Tax=Agaricus bisporus var. burnettii (strain JB137-S8 / ATCC MYA-4627 / FGSC 10392) TaxID=597362 RepID=K5X9T7_AGABU|nr:uncharacterized protein AGABI1DRAFT_113084 [Agaricus bisporus var. burnettii JB137-S8]EKM79802.1 hypothetical protein AGABI1DRAFT_113084 [Agaricus bisporus var. burnettii JB137-S8]